MTDLNQCRTHPTTGELMVAIQGLKKATALNGITGYIECKVGVDEKGEAVYAVRLSNSEETKQFRFQNLRPVLLSEAIEEQSAKTNTDTTDVDSYIPQKFVTEELPVKGSMVVITGLVKKRELNGMRGIVDMGPEESGEEGFVVSFEDFIGSERTTMRFLDKNLLVLEPAVMEYVNQLCMNARELERKNILDTDKSPFTWSSVVKKVRKKALFQKESCFQLSYFAKRTDSSLLLVYADHDNRSLPENEQKRVVIRHSSGSGGSAGSGGGSGAHTLVCYERKHGSGTKGTDGDDGKQMFLKSEAPISEGDYQYLCNEVITRVWSLPQPGGVEYGHGIPDIYGFGMGLTVRHGDTRINNRSGLLWSNTISGEADSGCQDVTDFSAKVFTKCVKAIQEIVSQAVGPGANCVRYEIFMKQGGCLDSAVSVSVQSDEVALDGRGCGFRGGAGAGAGAGAAEGNVKETGEQDGDGGLMAALRASWQEKAGDVPVDDNFLDDDWDVEM